MDFHPEPDRVQRAVGVEEGSTALPQRRNVGHDFDAPAWGKAAQGWRASNWRLFTPRLIDLERRARFARLPLDPR